jgi:hypothetical protein
MAIYLLILLGILAWRFVPRPWHPTTTFTTPHHIIYSTATARQTEATARALTELYDAYSNRFHALPQFESHPPKLKLKLFKNRDEMRWVNPGMGWAEAFYRDPYCQAYYSDVEINPYNWMLHESVHQLNNEVAHLHLEKWLEEGLAEYFSTSRLTPQKLILGQIDPNTYPIWWIDDLATNADLSENLRNGSVIPLREIILNRGGPNMSTHVNLYYLHWWSLTYFIFESPQHRDHTLELVQRGGNLEAFEQLIDPVGQIQPEWHAFIRNLKAKLSAKPSSHLPLSSSPN